MRYAIEIEKRSSDEGGSEESIFPVGEWRDIEKAKLALRRIRNTYIVDSWDDDPDYRRRTTNEQHRQALIAATGTDEYPDFKIAIELDDGTEEHIHCSWRGWGERLLRAEIIEIVEEDGDLRFAPKNLSTSEMQLRPDLRRRSTE